MVKYDLPYRSHINDAPIRGFADHESGLWRAVITQALMDASSHSKKTEAKRSKTEAIQWLKGESDDFLDVCDQANLNPSYVREKAVQALLRGCNWRLPAGQGWRTQARLKAAAQYLQTSTSINKD
jgi:hypothetical protein